MNNFKARLVNNIVISLILIAVLFSGYLFFRFNVGNYSESIAKLRTELTDRSTRLTSSAILRFQYNNQVKNYLNVLYNVVPLQDELIDLSKDFQFIANKNKVAYNFTFAGESGADKYGLRAVNFRLMLTGELADLFKAVKDLQDFRYVKLLNSVNFNRQSDGSVRMNIEGQVFFR